MTGRRALSVVIAAGTGVLAACGSGGSLAQQVRTWAASSGWSSSVSVLQSDLRRVSQTPAGDAGARRTVCDVLVTDALAANQQLPTPDAALTSLLSKAYGAAATAGRHCYADGSQMAAVAAEERTATMALVQAQARYDELTSNLRGSP